MKEVVWAALDGEFGTSVEQSLGHHKEQKKTEENHHNPGK